MGFENVSEERIRLKKVSSRCGCSGGGLRKKGLGGNEESIISVSFDGKKRGGRIDGEGLVYRDVWDF